MTTTEANPRTIDSGCVKARLAELHLRDYLEFVVWPILEPATPFVGGWPIDAMCEHLEAVTAEDIRHLLITIPPRHTKSTTVSIAWPTWSWIAHPEIRFMFGSYAAELSTEHAVSSRRVLESGFYRAHYGDRFYLVSDQNVKTFYENSKRGYRMSSGVQGTVQGRGGDVLCFPGDEVVWTEHGPRRFDTVVESTAPIKVWSMNQRIGDLELRPVTARHVNPSSAIVRVTLSDGTAFRCTPDHRVWTARGWVEAERLNSRDVLPGSALPNIADRSLGYAKACGQRPRIVSALADLGHCLFGYDGPRPGMVCTSQDVARPTSVLGNGRPCLATSNLLNRTAPDAVALGQDVRSVHAARNRSGVCSRQDSARAPFQQWECAVPFGIGDVFGSCAPSEVLYGVVGRIAVEVSRFLAWFRCADERDQHHLMHVARERSSVAARVEACVSAMWRCTKQLAFQSYRNPRTKDRSIHGFDTAQVGDEVAVETSDRFPVFIERLGHVGVSYCLSVEGNHNMIVGRRAGVLVSNCFDDPHNLKDIDSDVARTSVLNVFRNVWSQRFNDAKRGHYVVVMQRGHEDDLANMVMERGGFEHLNLPSEYERTPFVIVSGEKITIDGFARDVQERDELITALKRKHRKATIDDKVQISAIGWQDPRDQDGELLWPARFGPDEIAAAKRDLLETGFATQHQQRPVPQEGAMFKRAKFKVVGQAELTELGDDYVEARGWDFAATEETPGKDPDYTVGAKVRRYKKTGHIVVMDIVRGRYGPADGDTVLRVTTQQDGRGCSVREEQEPGASGVKVIAAHVILLVGYDYAGVRSTGDKATKAKPFSVQVDNGKVWLLEGEWNTTYLAEFTMFPKGKHDDQVDGCVIAFNEVALGARRGFKSVKLRGTH